MARKKPLTKIKAAWLTRISESLAQGEGVRESFLGQLELFYNLMERCIDEKDPMLLDPLLGEWVSARTETELDIALSSIQPILSEMFKLTLDVLREQLNLKDTLDVISALLPVYSHAMEFTSTKETILHIQHNKQELDKVHLTLEHLEESKSDFISVAAHELKTPLTLIEGYASMLQEMLPEGLGNQQENLCINGIKAGTKRLHEIVNDMIDVSIIDNNLLALNFQPVWLNKLLSQVQRDLTESIWERHLNLTIRSFPGSNEMFFGDGERLFQAFNNVITNAIKFTPDYGSILVDGRILPGFIEIIITDTGIGIDPEDQSRIFEKFRILGSVLLHSTGKTKYKGGGPGLGLPITKGIIEAHDGAVWVESEGYNEEVFPGSTFHILLPLRKSPPNDKIAKLFRPLIGD